MPIIRLKKYLAQNPDAKDIEVSFSDAGGVKDIPAFCNQQQLRCELINETMPYRILIQR